MWFWKGTESFTLLNIKIALNLVKLEAQREVDSALSNRNSWIVAVARSVPAYRS